MFDWAPRQVHLELNASRGRRDMRLAGGFYHHPFADVGRPADTLRVARPPSTPKTWPVIQLLAGSSKKAMAEATSSGSPIRPRGCMAWEAFRDISLWVSRAVSGVRTRPGATQLTRMF